MTLPAQAQNVVSEQATGTIVDGVCNARTAHSSPSAACSSASSTARQARLVALALDTMTPLVHSASSRWAGAPACLVPRARAAAQACSHRPTPHRRAVARTTCADQPRRNVVERLNVCSVRKHALRCGVDALPSVTIGSRAGAVHCPRGLHSVGLAAGHLKAAVRDRALNQQTRRLDGKRLQEEDAMQCRRRCSTRHLEVARAREDDAALHDVVGDEGVKQACGGGAEYDICVQTGRTALRK